MRNGKLFLTLSMGAIIFYVLHRIVLSQLDSRLEIRDFYYSLETVYLFFFACSLVVLRIVLFVRQKNLDATGQAFIAATFVKMVVAYAFLYPALNQGESGPGKTNFFVVFLLFLALETAICTRLLNKS